MIRKKSESTAKNGRTGQKIDKSALAFGTSPVGRVDKTDPNLAIREPARAVNPTFRKSAKGRCCDVWGCRDTQTVVGAHNRFTLPDFPGAGGAKPHDGLILFLCVNCHSILDRRVPVSEREYTELLMRIIISFTMSREEKSRNVRGYPKRQIRSACTPQRDHEHPHPETTVNRLPLFVAAAILAASVSPAIAQNMGNHNNFANQANNEGVQIDSSSDSNTVANARGGAGGVGGTGVGGNSTIGSGAVNNSLSFKAAKRSADTAIAPSMIVGGSDSCRTPWGAGGQVPTFGLSFGGASRDDFCEKLKLTNVFRSMNMFPAVNAMLCQMGEASVIALRNEGIDCNAETGGAVQVASASKVNETQCWNAYYAGAEAWMAVAPFCGPIIKN